MAEEEKGDKNSPSSRTSARIAQVQQELQGQGFAAAAEYLDKLLVETDDVIRRHPFAATLPTAARPTPGAGGADI